MDLRRDFFSELLTMARKDEKIMLITCDLGYSFLEEYQETLPKQFINAGIAEQNAIGVACGLALSGYKPYVYSGLIFLLMRAYEFVRDDICYNNLDVKLIGTGASGFLGMTHNLGKYENEESLLENLPNIKRYYPKTNKELKEAMISKGCAYIRI